MPKLTEPLCAMRRPIKKFSNYKVWPAFRQMAPAELKETVNPKEEKMKPGKMCQAELAIMLQCMKTHDFKEASCAKEVASFYKCYNEFERRKDVKETLKQRGIIGLPLRSMSGKQCNELLKGFPQPRKDRGS